MVSFNINNAFKEVFGLAVSLPSFFPLAIGEARDVEDILKEDPTAYRSIQTGAVMWDKFDFQWSESFEDNESSFGKGATDISFKFPDTTVVRASIEKVNVITPLVGGNGQITEIINNGYFVLRFTGFIINTDSDTYPIDKVREFREMFNQRKELRVTSKLINTGLGITDVVVQYMDLPPEAGTGNAAPFEIVVTEDRVYTLDI